MRTSVDLREVTDRVLGLSLPRVRRPARRFRRTEGPIAVILLLISALTTAAGLALWAGGHGLSALQVFGGTILLLALALRLL